MQLLNEILELKYRNRTERTKKTDISEVYGIIYRIYCIPERKSYVGQTFSHSICLKNLQRHGLISRCKIHYRAKDLDDHKERPLYKALNNYLSNQFEVHEEKRLYGKDIANINQVEAEYIKKYNSVHPNGYNIEEVGKKYSRILEMLAEHHGFEIQRFEYIDNTRKTRCKDVSFGVRFGLRRTAFSKDVLREHLQSIEIENIRLVESKHDLRLIIREKNNKDNIRVYFRGSKEECEEFARELSPYVELAESFRGAECYKHETKLEKAVSFPEITKVTGKIYENKAAKNQTYLLIFYGRKDGKIQPILRLSFGGRAFDIRQSYQDAMEFVERFKARTQSEPVYNLQQ